MSSVCAKCQPLQTVQPYSYWWVGVTGSFSNWALQNKLRDEVSPSAGIPVASESPFDIWDKQTCWCCLLDSSQKFRLKAHLSWDRHVFLASIVKGANNKRLWSPSLSETLVLCHALAIIYPLWSEGLLGEVSLEKSRLRMCSGQNWVSLACRS